MADGQGTHATQNRLKMYAAVEAALRETYDETPDACCRDRFLAVLRGHHHVVGHITDRHHELQARCAEFLQAWDSDAVSSAVLTDTIEAIRAIVTHPMRPTPPGGWPDPAGTSRW